MYYFLLCMLDLISLFFDNNSRIFLLINQKQTKPKPYKQTEKKQQNKVKKLHKTEFPQEPPLSKRVGQVQMIQTAPKPQLLHYPLLISLSNMMLDNIY